jgi:hypothetical protein
MSFFLALFIMLMFSSTASAGFLGGDFLGEKYRCKIDHTQLDASTGIEEEKKYIYEFHDDGGCNEADNGLSKKINKWLMLSVNHILEDISLKGIECKEDDSWFNGMLGEEWGQYYSCSEEQTLDLINKVVNFYSKQVSNKIKYPRDYPLKVTFDDI